MIFNGVELPRLLPIDRAAELLRVDEVAIVTRLNEGTVQGMRVGGVLRVLTESIADRLGEITDQRPNQESD